MARNRIRLLLDFKFVKLASHLQLMAAAATYRQCLRTLCRVQRRKRCQLKAEINCLLSSNHENHVATAQAPFYFPLSASLFPLALTGRHKRLLKRDEVHGNANCHLSASSRRLAPGKAQRAANDERTNCNNDVVPCCNRHTSSLTAQGIFIPWEPWINVNIGFRAMPAYGESRHFGQLARTTPSDMSNKVS